jgi:hypothetical protein
VVVFAGECVAIVVRRMPGETSIVQRDIGVLLNALDIETEATKEREDKKTHHFEL